MSRSFNGSTDRIDLSTVDLTPNNTVISLAAWIKTSGATGAIYGSDNGSGGGRFCQFRVFTSTLQLVLFNGGTGRTWTSTTAPNSGAWVHVGASYDGTGGVVYVNGGAEGASNQVVSNTSDGHAARIGAHIAGITNQPFNGSIAEVALWKRALSANEFKALAGGLTPEFFAPVHYWPLWGVDSPEPDLGSG